MKLNRDMRREKSKKDKDGNMNGDEGGSVHMLGPEMRHSLLLVAREDVET